VLPRLVVLTVALVLAAGAWAASLAPTPEQTTGPFYPSVLPEDRDADLVVIKGRPARAQGTVLHLTGRVTDTSGAAVVDALVEIWQVDNKGAYLNTGSANHTTHTHTNNTRKAELIAGVPK